MGNELNKTPPLAKEHRGMRVSASGLLGRIASGSKVEKGQRYMCGELLRHMEQLGKEYYSGNIEFVDVFLQHYCLDDNRPN